MSLGMLKKELSSWFLTSHIRQRDSRSLLSLLRRVDPESVFAQLPKDPRSLFPKFITNVDITTMDPGEFAYLGMIL